MMELVGEAILLIGRQHPWLWPLVGAVMGGVAGSFLSCAAVRLPLGQSLRHPAHSCCDVCHSRLTLPDLVPLLSWLLLRGRCRHCGAPYGVHNLLWEITLISLGTSFGWLAQPATTTPLIIFIGLLGICLLTCAGLLPAGGQNMHKHHIPERE